MGVSPNHPSYFKMFPYKPTTPISGNPRCTPGAWWSHHATGTLHFSAAHPLGGFQHAARRQKGGLFAGQGFNMDCFKVSSSGNHRLLQGFTFQTEGYVSVCVYIYI